MLFATFELEAVLDDEIGDLIAVVAGSGPRVIQLIVHLARVVVDGKRAAEP